MRSEPTLQSATMALRGMLRYKNAHSLSLVAMLLDGVREAAAEVEADISITPAMVIVDPDFQEAWEERMAKRRKLLASLRERAQLIDLATKRAIEELEQKGGRP